jgi:Domain of unknown function (DUF1918)
VPSIASSAETRRSVGDSIAVMVTRCRPTGLGRSGERVANTLVNPSRPRYEIRWEDGHTSILAPSAGAARIEQKKRRRAKAEH